MRRGSDTQLTYLCWKHVGLLSIKASPANGKAKARLAASFLDGPMPTKRTASP